VRPVLRECELRDGLLSGSALAVAAYLAGTAAPGEVLATSTVQDLVAGSGIDVDERGTLGELRLFSVLRPT
jgi:class 3 adenylate cyclase